MQKVEPELANSHTWDALFGILLRNEKHPVSNSLTTNKYNKTNKHEKTNKFGD